MATNYWAADRLNNAAKVFALMEELKVSAWDIAAYAHAQDFIQAVDVDLKGEVTMEELYESSRELNLADPADSVTADFNITRDVLVSLNRLPAES